MLIVHIAQREFRVLHFRNGHGKAPFHFTGQGLRLIEVGCMFIHGDGYGLRGGLGQNIIIIQ